MDRLLGAARGFYRHLQQYTHGGRNAPIAVRISTQATTTRLSPAFQQRPRNRAISVDHRCYLYYHSSRAFRHVDTGGRIIRVKRTPPPSSKDDRQRPQGTAPLEATTMTGRGDALKAGRAPTTQSMQISGSDTNRRATIEPGNSGDAQSSADESELEAAAQLKKPGEELRKLALENYMRAEKGHEWWQENYASCLEQHNNAVNPGSPEWSPHWTQQEFELAYLAEGMRRTQFLISTEEQLDGALEFAKEVGLSVARWQRDLFPDDGSGYSVSEEAAMMNSIDPVRFQTWWNSLPSDKRELGGPDEIADADYNRGEYAGVHDWAYHSDVDTNLEQGIAHGEGSSTACGGWYRKRIDAAEASRPPWSIPEYQGYKDAAAADGS